MKKIKRGDVKNNKARNNKNSPLRTFFASILKFTVAIALLIMLGLAVNAGDVIVESGKLNVDSKLYVNDAGNVGIGTITPSQKLDVVGNVKGTGLCIGSDCRTSWPSGGSALPTGTSGQTLRHDGTNWVANSLLLNDGNNIQVQKNNEVYLDIKNTEASGKDFALVSAGSAGGIGVGKFSIYDKTAGTSRLTVDSNGNVGIGTTSPGAKLHVSDSGDTMIRIQPNSGANNRVSNYDFWGTFYNFPADTGVRRVANIQAGFATGVWGTEYMAFGLGSNDASVLPTERMRITGSGNVGIGTASPSEKLDVSGNVKASGIVYWGGGSGPRTESKDDAGAIASRSGFFQTVAPVNYYSGASSWQHLIESRHSNDANNYALQIAGSFYDQDLYFRKTNNNPATAWNKFIYQNSAGNVGIGTTAPDTIFQIATGNDRLAFYQSSDNRLNIQTLLDNQAFATYGAYGGNSENRLILQPLVGNVGIGTASPTEKLDVVGNVKGTGLCIGSDCRTSWPSGGSALPSGTSGQTLRHDGTNWVANSLLLNDGNNVQVQKNNEVYLDIKNTEASGKDFALVSAGSAGGIGVGKFSIYDKTAGTSRLTVDSNGNVGIGTTSPGEKLEVVGNIKLGTAGRGIYWDWPNRIIEQVGFADGSQLMRFRNSMGSAQGNTNGGFDFADSAGTSVLRINNGNVGIGTTGPGDKLTVVGGAITVTRPLGVTPSTNPDSNILVSLRNSDKSGDQRVLDLTMIGTTAVIRSIATNMDLDGGNVGIGTTAPGSKLTVNGNAEINNGYVYAYNNAYPIRLGELWGHTGLWNGNSGHVMYFSSDQYFQFLNRGGGYGPSVYAQDFYSNAAGVWMSQLCRSNGINCPASSSQWTTSGTNIYNSNTGNVGIGTASPASKLDVYGDIFSDGSNAWLFHTPDDGRTSLYFGRGSNGAISEWPIEFRAGGSAYFGGNVGIGTTGPGAKLDVDGNMMQSVSHGNNFKLWLSAARNYGGAGEVGLYSWVSEPSMSWTGAGIARNMYNTANFPRINTGLSGQMMHFTEGGSVEFTLETSGGTRTTPLAITNAGNVGIGTTGPNAKLDIGMGNDNIAFYQPSDNTMAIQGYIDNHWGDRTTYAGGCCNNLLLQPDVGSVGIGTTNPGYKLDVAGAAHATSFPTSSDARLKENVMKITNAVEKLQNINGVYFDWNDQYKKLGRATKGRQIGVIAQDVEKEFPELVTTWGNESYRAVDYGRMTGVLIEAIKEQQTQINEQQKQIEEMKKEIIMINKTRGETK